MSDIYSQVQTHEPNSNKGRIFVDVDNSPADTLVGSVDCSALHRFQVVRYGFPASVTAVCYSLQQGVFTASNLAEKLPAYTYNDDNSNLSIIKKID